MLRGEGLFLAHLAASDLWLRPVSFTDISKQDRGVSESRVDQVHSFFVSIDFHRPLGAIY